MINFILKSNQAKQVGVEVRQYRQLFYQNVPRYFILFFQTLLIRTSMS